MVSAMEDLETAVEYVPHPGRRLGRTAASEGGGGAAYREWCMVRALAPGCIQPRWLSASSRFYKNRLTTAPAELLSFYPGINMTSRSWSGSEISCGRPLR